VTTGNALAVADAYACVRVVADGVASLQPKVYRRTPAGRVPAGDDQRLVQLQRQATARSSAPASPSDQGGTRSRLIIALTAPAESADRPMDPTHAFGSFPVRVR
jgi:hypothetical protein